jgi:hypothetical protein
MTEEQYELENDYLTMARLCEKELKKFIRERDFNLEWRNMTGREQLIAKASFKSGFMKGFEGKYFGGTNG